jgi:hypothetical protein
MKSRRKQWEEGANEEHGMKMSLIMTNRRNVEETAN